MCVFNVVDQHLSQYCFIDEWIDNAVWYIKIILQEIMESKAKVSDKQNDGLCKNINA